ALISRDEFAWRQILSRLFGCLESMFCLTAKLINLVPFGRCRGLIFGYVLERCRARRSYFFSGVGPSYLLVLPVFVV
ncbi:hypothetical protein ACFVN2_15600, partial [Streptomyces rochei]|uniref:hypothetical protein n=1 Tax=Streptomyces rochei TaxID=1928 RepID=UPI0036BCC429